MKKRAGRRTFGYFCLFVFLLGLLGFGLVSQFNQVVINLSKPQIVAPEQAAAFDADCILVLGCGVTGDVPSLLLRHRIDLGIDLYKAGAAPKLLMSGDHGQLDYDEVNVMKDRALDHGIPSADVFMDHAGFSTYDSLVRAKEIFQVKKVVIVTQEYHLYRAIYIAKSLGLEVCGVAAYDSWSYSDRTYREVREVAARLKDILFAAFRPDPVYLGDAIPISGNGNATNG